MESTEFTELVKETMCALNECSCEISHSLTRLELFLILLSALLSPSVSLLLAGCEIFMIEF